MSKSRGITGIQGMILLAALIIVSFTVWTWGRKSLEARETCLGNLGQVGLAMNMYIQDYDERLPPRQIHNISSGRDSSWRTSLVPYLYDGPLCLRCPATSVNDVPDVEHDGLFRSYAVNSSVGDGKQRSGPFSDNMPNLRLNDIDTPSNLIVAVESTAAYNDFNVLAPQHFACMTDRTKNGGHLFTGHSGQSNFLFADGHAGTKNPISTIGATNSQPVNYWTIDNSPFSLQDRKTAQSVLKYGIEHGER